jgi:chromosome segregation ATPase
LQQKESTIKRLQVDLDSARADADASAARLARECSALRKAEQEVDIMKEERERVMREIKAFDADLILQTTEARRLKEQLLVLKDNDSAVQRVREELAGLKAEREAERVRGKEEVQRVKREVEGLKEEVKGLERWKVEHACGAYVQLSFTG